MRLEITRTEGCRVEAIAHVRAPEFSGAVERPNILLVCGDRSREVPAPQSTKSVIEDERDIPDPRVQQLCRLASEVAVGMCVGCPNNLNENW